MSKEKTQKQQEFTVRQLSEKEEEQLRLKKTNEWCVYKALQDCKCLNISAYDELCVQPCPPCPDIISLTLLDTKGNEVCTIRVDNISAGHCTGCTSKHRFTWSE